MRGTRGRSLRSLDKRASIIARLCELLVLRTREVRIIAITAYVKSPHSWGPYISGGRDSNSRPSRWQRDVLPTELPPHKITARKEFKRFDLISNSEITFKLLVPRPRLELGTPCSSGRCSTN